MATRRSRIRSRRAARWNVRLGSGEISEAERARMLEWMLEPGNAREYEAQRQLLDWTHDLAPAQKAELARTLDSRGRGRAVWLTAAACAVAGLMAGGLWLNATGGLPRAYASDIGQITSVSLPDGSITALNTGTRLAWLGGRGRHVRLLAGEALFEVRPDHRNPFQIDLKNSRITVVGTRFDVYEKPSDNVVVTVLEGRVVVQGLAGAGEWREELSAHEELEYTPQGRRVVRVVDPRSATDWRDGIFRSEGASLDRVVSELSRYTRSRIIIADPSLRALTVGGVFDIHDVPAALQRVTASADVPITVERDGDSFVLRRAPAIPRASAVPPPAASTPHGKGS
jgi:transmembrane sensor